MTLHNSQRAASAWQGAQPQKLTVSMLLPGTSSAAEWRDLLQSRRQFWPTLTTRHASLVPVSAEALQRERRQMQAKHLWYNVDIRWSDLKDKDSVGHSGPLGPWLLPLSSPQPSRSFRPTRSTGCFLSLSPASVQLGLSRSFRPTQSLDASVLAFTSLFYAFPPLPRLSQSFRLTRSLAISSPFLASALPLFYLGSWFHLSLNPVSHSGPLGSWRPLSLFSHSPCFLCHHSPLLLYRSDSAGHSGPLGLSQPSLSSLFPPSSLFHLSLIPVGHSGPLGHWLYT